jgi:hypothetical protein
LEFCRVTYVAKFDMIVGEVQMGQNLNGMTSGEMIFATIYSLSQKIMMLYSKAVLRETGLNWQDWRILRAVVSLQSCRAQDICEEIGIKKIAC